MRREHTRPPRRLTAGFGAAALALFTLPAPALAQRDEVSANALHQVGAQLVGAFTTSSPFTPTAPDHLWFDNGDGTYLFLHFDKPLKEATKLIYVGFGVPGRWCAEDRPSGYTHFHRTAKVADWNAGHGGATPGEAGIWLKHVAVEAFDFNMMGMSYKVAPGTDHKFMPTNPPQCGR